MADLRWAPGQEGGRIQAGEAGPNPTWVDNSGIGTFLNAILEKTKSDYERQQVARVEYEKQRMADEGAMSRAKYVADASIKQEELKSLYSALETAIEPEKIKAIVGRIAELTGQQPPQQDPLDIAIKNKDWNNLPPHPDGQPWTVNEIVMAAQGKVPAGTELSVGESFDKWQKTKKKVQTDMDKKKIAEERVSQYKSIQPGTPQDVIERGIPQFLQRQFQPDPLSSLSGLLGPGGPVIYGAAKEASRLPIIQPFVEPIKQQIQQIPGQIQSWYTGKPNLPVMIPPKE